MSMLELITKAVADKAAKPQAEYPIVLNPDDGFSNLKPEVENPDPALLAAPVSGWQFSTTDSQLIGLSKKLSTKLKRKLKDTNNFTKDGFVGILNPFLEKIMEVVGSSVRIDSSDERYTKAMLEKVGGLIGGDAVGLILDACLRVEMWDLLETMIANKFVTFSCYSSLVASIVAWKRSDLLCLCVKYAPDLGLAELLSILRYFLCSSKEAKSSMANVKKEWETNLTSATRIVSEESLSKKKLQVAREACLLLMIACDGFTMPELCLHYLFASSNVDEVVFSTAVGKLNGQEIMRLIKYLGKWLKKYERFPQAIPCSKASSTLGLKACDWVPKLEDVLRSLGLILDENFSTLVLHSEFHEELKSMQRLVAAMSSEAQVCCSVANVIENLRNEGRDEQN